jgi:hypothetical protein
MDIFELRLQPVFLGICISTKVILAGLADLEETFDEENRTWQVSRIKKRLLDLEIQSIIPGIQRIMNDPQYLPEHLEDPVHQFQTSQQRNIFGVHLKLLMATSSAIISFITSEGVGTSTFEEVKQWFLMMKKLLQVQSYWPMQELHEFEALILSFDDFEVNVELSVKEYPFFSHMGLLLQVAYTVDHLTFDHVTNLTKNGISSEDYEKWENVSGEICKQVLFANVSFGLNAVLSYKLSQEATENKCKETSVELGSESESEIDYGFESLSDDEYQIDPEPELQEPMFLWWMLPYDWLFKELRDSNKNVRPHVTHQVMMGVVVVTMQEIIKETENENTEETRVFDDLTEIFDEQVKLLEKRIAIFMKREKSSKHEYEDRKKTKSNTNKEYEYEPRYGNRFDRDIFIMGKASQYHSTTPKKNRNEKKTKKTKKTKSSKLLDLCECIRKKQKYPERS